MSELREVIGALQSEVEIETAVSELGAGGSTALAATVASFAGAGAVLAATGGASAPTPLATLASGGSVGGLAALFGHHHEAHVRM